ncbi:hypothetical protein GPECTOR_13g833 [Gonium pectorale]|uniref:Uncharacterized protein n=1 Tax=Gonium pectorale TaxID=33097 RepID=A0A150GNJ7_GONPE|nr:hypothetical protein GPECTOR_13g833 [Gonium pectorale]|eukprot:KXZ51345.1 hypothetical protein GPECTOR_13g833 [Gonium pectorale]
MAAGQGNGRGGEFGVENGNGGGDCVYASIGCVSDSGVSGRSGGSFSPFNAAARPPGVGVGASVGASTSATDISTQASDATSEALDMAAATAAAADGAGRQGLLPLPLPLPCPVHTRPGAGAGAGTAAWAGASRDPGVGAWPPSGMRQHFTVPCGATADGANDALHRELAGGAAAAGSAAAPLAARASPFMTVAFSAAAECDDEACELDVRGAGGAACSGLAPPGASAAWQADSARSHPTALPARTAPPSSRARASTVPPVFHSCWHASVPAACGRRTSMDAAAGPPALLGGDALTLMRLELPRAGAAGTEAGGGGADPWVTHAPWDALGGGGKDTAAAAAAGTDVPVAVGARATAAAASAASAVETLPRREVAAAADLAPAGPAPESSVYSFETARSPSEALPVSAAEPWHARSAAGGGGSRESGLPAVLRCRLTVREECDARSGSAPRAALLDQEVELPLAAVGDNDLNGLNDLHDGDDYGAVGGCQVAATALSLQLPPVDVPSALRLSLHSCEPARLRSSARPTPPSTPLQRASPPTPDSPERSAAAARQAPSELACAPLLVLPPHVVPELRDLMTQMVSEALLVAPPGRLQQLVWEAAAAAAATSVTSIGSVESAGDAADPAAAVTTVGIAQQLAAAWELVVAPAEGAGRERDVHAAAAAADASGGGGTASAVPGCAAGSGLSGGAVAAASLTWQDQLLPLLHDVGRVLARGGRRAEPTAATAASNCAFKASEDDESSAAAMRLLPFLAALGNKPHLTSLLLVAAFGDSASGAVAALEQAAAGVELPTAPSAPPPPPSASKPPSRPRQGGPGGVGGSNSADFGVGGAAGGDDNDATAVAVEAVTAVAAAAAAAAAAGGQGAFVPAAQCRLSSSPSAPTWAHLLPFKDSSASLTLPMQSPSQPRQRQQQQQPLSSPHWLVSRSSRSFSRANTGALDATYDDDSSLPAFESAGGSMCSAAGWAQWEESAGAAGIDPRVCPPPAAARDLARSFSEAVLHDPGLQGMGAVLPAVPLPGARSPSWAVAAAPPPLPSPLKPRSPILPALTPKSPFLLPPLPSAAQLLLAVPHDQHRQAGKRLHSGPGGAGPSLPALPSPHAAASSPSTPAAPSPHTQPPPVGAGTEGTHSRWRGECMVGPGGGGGPGLCPESGLGFGFGFDPLPAPPPAPKRARAPPPPEPHDVFEAQWAAAAAAHGLDGGGGEGGGATVRTGPGVLSGLLSAW